MPIDVETLQGAQKTHAVHRWLRLRIGAGLRLCRRFRASGSGVAAVEFALILPFMFLLYIGVVETTQYAAADRKSIIFARTLSDLTAQGPLIDYPTYNGPYIDDNSRDTIFAFASATLYPFAATNAAMRITQYAIDNNGGVPRAFVDWYDTCTWQPNSTCAYGPNPNFAQALNPSDPSGRCAIDNTVPLDLLKPNSYLIRGEVSYHYAPIMAGLFASTQGGTDGYFNFFASGGFQIYNYTHSRPRSSAPIVRAFADGSSTFKKADGTPNNAAAVCAGFTP